MSCLVKNYFNSIHLLLNIGSYFLWLSASLTLQEKRYSLFNGSRIHESQYSQNSVFAFALCACNLETALNFPAATQLFAASSSSANSSFQAAYRRKASAGWCTMSIVSNNLGRDPSLEFYTRVFTILKSALMLSATMSRRRFIRASNEAAAFFA